MTQQQSTATSQTADVDGRPDETPDDGQLFDVYSYLCPFDDEAEDEDMDIVVAGGELGEQ